MYKNQYNFIKIRFGGKHGRITEEYGTGGFQRRTQYISRKDSTGAVKDGEEAVVLTQRLSTCFVGVMAAAIVISLFSVVPRANHLLGNANALLGEVNDRLEVLDETIASVKTMSDSITSVGDQLDTFIEDNSTALQGVVKKMDSIDFEGLNKSIKNLGDVVEPLAKFFKVF